MIFKRYPAYCISFAFLALAAAPCFAADGEQPSPRAPVAVSRGADGALILSGADCAVLERQAAALADWRGRLHEGAASADFCRCEADTCSLRIASAAPEFVNLMHGIRAGRWGPNCWNAALVSNKILSAPGFTSPAEMTFWMRSPLCRALRAGETPRPGDIIAVRDRAGEEVHGFVYLTEELAFSKNYLTAAAPYALQSPEEVYKEFPVPAECRKPGASAPGCPAYADHFRCSPREDYLQSAPGLPDKDYPEAAAAVSAAEGAISWLVLRWRTDPELQSGAAEILAAQEKILLPARELARNRSGLLWRALELRADSLLHQISLI